MTRMLCRRRQCFPQGQEYGVCLSFSFARFELAPDMTFLYTHDSEIADVFLIMHFVG